MGIHEKSEAEERKKIMFMYKGHITKKYIEGEKRRTSMKTKLALLLVVLMVAFATPAMAQRIQASIIFPYTLG